MTNEQKQEQIQAYKAEIMKAELEAEKAKEHAKKVKRANSAIIKQIEKSME